MKIVAFGGSNSQHSINKQLATYAASLFDNGTVEVLDLNDFAMPLFSVDLEKEIGQHELAKTFLQKIENADLLVISLAENNGNYSAAFKNLFDWSSRIMKEIFQQKPMLLMATSPGARGGASVLEIANNALPRYGAQIKATFSLPAFNANFDLEENKISNEELNKELKDIIKSSF
ncbi:MULTISPECIES: NADPH-dependent FMN reductase [Flavobacterium]|jgi:chromate reductase, NAD(P)H dehydrogenase (quinone)|uniref:NADPH-dependent FMN reductase n=1 Tax=Flavobacterium tructae TaxID=1114873 RepID=A0A1S1J7K7_9FLAO|nr:MULTISPECIES: NAD(P)H-dependent oxidoreductase [Flavobacterium]MDL2142137.1 NAD(P)H-dependent oxidoreductase [Flavobacterium tructae]OHT45489.1 NADPH-dependent FMN reductase [Flavobacterium tructae]OXB18148.1 NADPH-dependent oxidoreductase [Flavobacterium tructae]OXB21295.1 NADPH-dependent oxidoreductase [Flavobacterium tructae]URC10926.1 NAD(P)H-dependent oxidoreductase [Flavobacterium sp. B183]